MKYGRVNIPIPDFSEDIAALKDLLEKGEIDKSEYTKKIEYFRKIRLSYIVATNGGYTAPKKWRVKDKVNLSESKEEHLANRVLDYREEFEKFLEAEEAESKAEDTKE